MSIPGRLFSETVNVVYRAPGTVNRYGRAVLGEVTRADAVPAWVEKVDAVEEAGASEVTTARYRVFLNPAAGFTPPGPQDEIEWQGRTFRIEGGAHTFNRPGRGTHHYEVTIAEVENA